MKWPDRLKWGGAEVQKNFFILAPSCRVRGVRTWPFSGSTHRVIGGSTIKQHLC